MKHTFRQARQNLEYEKFSGALELVKYTSGAELVLQSTATATFTVTGVVPIDGARHSIAPVSATRAATVMAWNLHPPVPKSSVSGVPVAD
jgi:hypothetical protein